MLKFQIFFDQMFNGSDYHIAKTDEIKGLQAVDFIRKELGVQLTLDRMEASKPESWGRVTQIVSEEFARKSGRFEKQFSAYIHTAPEHLNKYFYPTVEVKRNNETDEIITAKVVYKMDYEAVLKAWESDGFPDFWGANAEQIADYEKYGD